MTDIITMARRCFASIGLAFVTVSLCLASEPDQPSEPPPEAGVTSNRFGYEERPKRGRVQSALLKYQLSPADAKPGETVVLSITMELDDNWHTFSLTQPEFGIAPTVINLDKLYGLQLLKIEFQADREPEIERPIEDLAVEVHRQQVTWTMPLKVLASASPGRYGVSGTLSYQLCKGGSCIPPVSQSFQLGDFAGLQPAHKPSTPAPPSRVTPVVPATLFQARPYGSLFDFIVTAMTLGSTLILTPWLLSIAPAVLGYFAKRCESDCYRPLFPLFSFYGGLIGVSTIFVGAAVALSDESKSLELSYFASHPLLYLVLSVAYLAMITHLLGAIELPDFGIFGDCLGAMLLSFGVSIALLPLSLAYASILLIGGRSVWSATGLLAFLSGIAASFSAVALLPHVLKAISSRSDLLRAIRIICAMCLLGCFANSAQVTAALMFPALPGATPVATWVIPSRTDLGITYLLDFDHATTIASHRRQPLLLIFSGVNAQNSRLMEQKLKQPQNLARIERFVCAELFTDKVPRIADKVEGKRIVERNWDLQVELCGDMTIPTLLVMSPDGKTVLASYVGLEQNEGEIAAFLDEGWTKWQASRTGRPH